MDSLSEPIDLLVIGAGLGGLCMGAIARKAGLRIRILERRHEVGGTWSQNVYPGCACDTQSHHYSLSFALNPAWTQRYAPQPEILAYLKKVADDFRLTDSIHFGEAVSFARFDAATGSWMVRCDSGNIHHARFVVSAVGQLNQPAVPDLPGRSSFPGKTMHTAEWDASYDFRGRKVAVIGNGASAIQLIPELAKSVAHMWVFQRSPSWLVPKLNRHFSPSERKMLRRFPLLMRLYRWAIYWNWERSWPEFLVDSPQARKRARLNLEAIRRAVTKPGLLGKLIPHYPLGCKRILLSDDFLDTMQAENVTLETSRIDRIEGGEIVTEAGSRIAVDCIVYATGFKANDFLPGMTVLGRNGKNLKDEWAEAGGAYAYLGMAVPGFPNFFMAYGPNTNLGHNSIVFMLECQTRWILRLIFEAKRRRKSVVEVKPSALDAYSRRLERDLAKTAWAGGCSSWYKSPQGKIINNWSSSTVRYWRVTRRVRAGDFSWT
jgi:cation diffusion facilitator CzcD-associated flavoprotein CzcO